MRIIGLLATIAFACHFAPASAQEEPQDFGDFDLGSFGGVEESTAPNGQRVRRTLVERPHAAEDAAEAAAAPEANAEADSTEPAAPPTGRYGRLSFEAAVEQARRAREGPPQPSACNPDPDLIQPRTCFEEQQEAVRSARRADEIAAGAALSDREAETVTSSECVEIDGGLECSASTITGTSEEARARLRELLDRMGDDRD